MTQAFPNRFTQIDVGMFLQFDTLYDWFLLQSFTKNLVLSFFLTAQGHMTSVSLDQRHTRLKNVKKPQFRFHSCENESHLFDSIIYTIAKPRSWMERNLV